MKRGRSQGFTLIEVLIVVVIMAILAATVIPQFSSSTDDARESAVTFNAHSLRTQIEMYKVHHLGEYPAITGSSLPQLTGKTNAAGDIGTGDAYPYGPYIAGDLPKNPYNDSNKVVAGAGAAVVAGGAGWQYDVNTGNIWPNNDEYFED
jgi:general secretion pathway protein G